MSTVTSLQASTVNEGHDVSAVLQCNAMSIFDDKCQSTRYVRARFFRILGGFVTTLLARKVDLAPRCLCHAHSITFANSDITDHNLQADLIVETAIG